MSDVLIRYCPVRSGYDRRAASLAAEINEQTEHAATIESGESGQFDVIVGGRTVFSKRQAGRFPEHDEVLALL